MPITRGRRIAPARIRTLLERLLDTSTLCAIATVSGSRAYVHTAYFAWSPDLRLVWISEPQAQHSKNLRANPSAAIAVFDSHQAWGGADRGLQLFGRARELEGRAADRAQEIYAVRFPDYVSHAARAYRSYELRPRTAKLFDETELGGGVFVTARVATNGALEWLRTEIYSGAS